MHARYHLERASLRPDDLESSSAAHRVDHAAATPGPAGKATPLDAQSSAAATAGLGALAQQSAPGAKPVAGTPGMMPGAPTTSASMSLFITVAVAPGRVGAR